MSNGVARVTSNSTSFLPLAGSLASNVLTSASPATVESTTGWNARMGGSFSMEPLSTAAASCLSMTCVSSYDWIAASTGNELYLNGLNSGTMSSHADLENLGSIDGQLATPA